MATLPRTGALDSATGVVVLDVLDRINRELGTTTVVITHNASIAAMAHRAIHMGDGRLQSVYRNVSRKAPREITW